MPNAFPIDLGDIAEYKMLCTSTAALVSTIEPIMRSSAILVVSSISALSLAAPTRPLYLPTKRNNNGTGLLPAPSGGVEVLGTPDYHAQSDFDYESFVSVLSLDSIQGFF